MSSWQVNASVRSLALGATALGTILWHAPLIAQVTPATASVNDDIIVTARKREETSIAVPVQISAIGAADLQRRAIVSLDILSHAIPQVMIGEAAGGVQGGTVGIRGISTGEQNPFADQAVSFNIDGAQISRASPRRMAQMDLAQVEVLKGPQALFFGKNSPGGVISIRTADPTTKFEAKTSLGYEIEAHEWRGEGYISGPITDTLGARFAFFGSTMRGWSKNIAVGAAPYAPPKDTWGPGTDEYAGRLTLKYTPSDVFNARLKTTYSFARNNGSVGIAERFFCPTGTAQTGDTIDDCTLNHRVVRGDVGSGPGRVVNEQGDGASFNNGVPYEKQTQWLSSLEMNLKLSDQLTLTSLSSYYYNNFRGMDNYTLTAIPTKELASANHEKMKELGQELRIQSDFDGPLNFLIGGYLQSSKLEYNVRSVSPVVPANVSRKDDTFQNGSAYSAFAQLRWNIVPTLELSVGGRYSYEKKHLRAFTNYIQQNFPRPRNSWNDFSPEVMLTYRPTNRLTIYGGYKHGFLSGGYNSGSGNFTTPRDFNQTTIKGFEGGVKARVGDVRVNLGVYSYKVRGLQVSTIITDPTNPFTTVQIVNNAGGATLKGVEADFNWTTPVRGLSLNGALAYNRARYQDFITTCWTGQTKAAGCIFIPSPNGPIIAPTGTNGTLQQLAGTEIVRAPDWNATIGADYQREIAAGWAIGISGNGSYTSAYWANPTEAPASRQKGYWLLDATVRLFSDDNGLEFAVIGNNLTNKLFITRSTGVPFSGSGTGGTGPSVQADEWGVTSRGRQLMFRVSKKF